MQIQNHHFKSCQACLGALMQNYYRNIFMNSDTVRIITDQKKSGMLRKSI